MLEVVETFKAGLGDAIQFLQIMFTLGWVAAAVDGSIPPKICALRFRVSARDFAQRLRGDRSR